MVEGKRCIGKIRDVGICSTRERSEYDITRSKYRELLRATFYLISNKEAHVRTHHSPMFTHQEVSLFLIPYLNVRAFSNEKISAVFSRWFPSVKSPNTMEDCWNAHKSFVENIGSKVPRQRNILVGKELDGTSKRSRCYARITVAITPPSPHRWKKLHRYLFPTHGDFMTVIRRHRLPGGNSFHSSF